MMPVAKLTLIKSYPREQILSIMNYAVMPALIGPLVGGYLVELASWHWIFLISVPIGMIGLSAGYQLMPNYVEKNANMDLLGFLLFGGSMASFIIFDNQYFSLNILFFTNTFGQSLLK